MPARRRNRLVKLAGDYRASRTQADRAADMLTQAVSEAVSEGASFRDVAATTGLPHQTLHQLVRGRSVDRAA